MRAPVRFINPEGLVRPQTYTQLVEIAGPARMVHVSGQLGTTPDGKLVGRDFRAQVEQVFANLETALASVGAKFVDVVKINSFLTDMANLPMLREVRAAKLNVAALPASTTIEVSGFALAGALLEVEVIAVVASRPARRPTPVRKLKARRTRK